MNRPSDRAIAQAFAEFQEATTAVPVGHYDGTKGSSTCNWRRSFESSVLARAAEIDAAAAPSGDLLPCPFCGTCDPHVMGPTCKRSDPYNPADRLFPTVRCRRCFVDVGGDDDDYTCATAVAKWNTRATAAPVVVGEDDRDG